MSERLSALTSVTTPTLDDYLATTQAADVNIQSKKLTHSQLLSLFHSNDYKSIRTLNATSSISLTLDFNNIISFTGTTADVNCTVFDNGAPNPPMGWMTWVMNQSNYNVTVATNGDATITLTAALNNSLILQPGQVGFLIKIADDGTNKTWLFFNNIDFSKYRGMVPVYGATTVAPNATYSNGTNGVGATLTGNTIGSFSDDGVSYGVGETILVKDFTGADAYKNGLYVFTYDSPTGYYIMTRPDYYNSPSKIQIGDQFYVLNGTQNGQSVYVQQSVVSQVGVTDITFYGLNIPPKPKIVTVTTYNPVLSDANNLLIFNNSAGCTVIISSSLAVNFKIGDKLKFYFSGSNPNILNVIGDTGVTFVYPLTFNIYNGGYVEFIKVDSDVWLPTKLTQTYTQTVTFSGPIAPTSNTIEFTQNLTQVTAVVNTINQPANGNGGFLSTTASVAAPFVPPSPSPTSVCTVYSNSTNQFGVLQVANSGIVNIFFPGNGGFSTTGTIALTQPATITYALI